MAPKAMGVKELLKQREWIERELFGRVAPFIRHVEKARFDGGEVMVEEVYSDDDDQLHMIFLARTRLPLRVQEFALTVPMSVIDSGDDEALARAASEARIERHNMWD